jgi:protein-S-isoprenylcysteine O-methyltransferase Ste14
MHSSQRNIANVILFLKSLLFTILLPGTVTVLMPWQIISNRHLSIHWGPLRVLALVPLIVGVNLLSRCIWDFAASGRGTLAPIDPPKTLVVRGLYRYVRNPMYVAVLLILVAEAWLFSSRALLLYAAGCFVIIHAFVLLYEEPHLRRQFGISYTQYCEKVSRWIPSKPPP